MDQIENILLASSYLGPIQYFSRFTLGIPVIIEQYDSYIKQTYRNRCVIAAANGALNLSIPVCRNRGEKTLTKEVRIDYDTNWQKMHHRGIISAYRLSPYFEYYFDDLEILILKKSTFLIDLNLKLIQWILGQLKIDCKISLSDSYIKSGDKPDLRQIISPKCTIEDDPEFQIIPYHQVFIEKYGFLPNLSIIDLVFNIGPDAKNYLKRLISPQNYQTDNK